MLYPFTFQPIFKERIWGGRRLEQLYRKSLPPSVPVGESWEISDRPGDESIITNGTLAGKTLRWLMENHRDELLRGAKLASSGRFPLLIKILDAQEKLSLQVHPPAAKAAQMGGEPKTEMWYVADATPEADLFVGLKHGSTRAEFEQKIKTGYVAECFHRIPVKRGDVMFLPSGRVHALGAGNVIFEIQQNSDTTYRVFDWNRVDASGKPRDLHIDQSLASIDFNDFEPPLVNSNFAREGNLAVRPLVTDPLFSVDLCEAMTPQRIPVRPGDMNIIGVLEGELRIEHPIQCVRLAPGQFGLIPAIEHATLSIEQSARFLRVRPGR